jgi:hypothetical protein
MQKSKWRDEDRAIRRDFYGLKKGFFYSFNVQVQRRCAALSRSVLWNDGLDVLALLDT